ncbi:efflux RND transporter periplasmic adaptor subunit [Tepidibacter hydrothermalis]|uniref:Efflux RND transporter periplasmic adaptor subunit n=1 Tax=Tepidibacter hydrothermalis TaxID=3036126 RepID=A0ABY8E9L9_9FIRM|nr:efflux RND transporter periplasmic adaptor subunit [Tepidibacter hydrothermalis]WFD09617.1 efflux RND transporter periplasmic adaptor subunit [Tepidibacter hydrothermalis]
MKKISLIFLVGCLLLSLSACTKAEAEKVEEIAKKVEVDVLQQKTTSVELEYTGIVKSDEMKEISFKSSGKISNIYVEKGDYIKKGQRLVELDKEDLNLQLSATKSKLDTSQLDIKKAEDSYNYKKELFEKTEEMYEYGAVSRDDYDKVKLDFDTSKTIYNQAKSNYETLKIDYDSKVKMVNDATVVSDMNGYVLDIKYEEGEMVSPGTPIVTIGNDKKVVKTGVAQKDLDKISLGKEVKIEFNDKETKGKVTNISKLPDKTTRTYDVEISLNETDYYLESIVNVKFGIGEETGIWIPINTILSSNIDYVYVAEDDRAVKRTVTIQKTKGSQAKVKGLKAGEKLIVNGMKSVKNGALLNINDKTSVNNK